MSPPFPLTSPIIRITSSLNGVLSFGTAVYESSRFSYILLLFVFVYICILQLYPGESRMAVSKLTHATGNIFMEQSFNDCLYNLGSIVTLASSTASSNVFSFSSRPSLCAGLLVPTGRAAQLGSHQEPPPLLLLTGSLSVALPPSPKQGWEHASLKLSSHHASYQSS